MRGAMDLGGLIEGLAVQSVAGPRHGEVRGIAYHSGKVNPNFLFVAMRGAQFDGHEFIAEAVRRGATAVIAEHAVSEAAGATYIQVPDSRKALAQVAAKFMGDPSSRLRVVGITGTNGKTTTTYLLESIFRHAGYRPGVVGTINYRFAGREMPAPNTTPESLDLHTLLAEMAEEGVSHVAMEVSSHALDQDRVEGVNFSVAVFTNLTPEHLDYHGTMESYSLSKARLFSHFLEQSTGAGNKYAVLNQDDPLSAHLRTLTTAEVLTYGTGAGVDITIEAARISEEGISGSLRTPQGRIEIRSPLLGRFNLYNLMAAAAAALGVATPLEAIQAGLAACGAVPGRMERIQAAQDLTVLVDYAHTADALANVLSTLRELGARRLITVFGCGGDRDRTKRPHMGGTAARMSDVVVVTSDNPRTERPEAIVAEIEAGVRAAGMSPFSAASGQGYLVEVDRTAAIGLALHLAKDGDIVLVAGKGHEDYQIIGKQKIHFDDRVVIKNVLESRSLS
jgi:UDP-N-acetylmuramoyl-L-alanyl-D-glutamate--2,6-diaminopimelate ligase